MHQEDTLFGNYEMPKEENVNVNDLKMKIIDNSFAKKFMSKHHYSKTCPNLYYSFGFYYSEDLVCVLCFGPPSGRLLAQAIMEGGTASNISELVRLFAFDWGPKNTESYCIGKAIQWIQENCPKLEVLVSYADPNEGHVGTIYQATNWLYTGQGSRIVDSYEFKIDGEWLHPRTIFAMCKTTSKEKVFEYLGREVPTRLVQHKYRYIYILGNKRERKEIKKKIKLKILPYPKKVNDDG